MTTPVYMKTLLRKCQTIKALALFLALLGTGISTSSAQVLTCPDSFAVTLPQNLCGIAVFYDTLEWSATIPVSDPVYFPFPGTTLPTGLNTITLAVTDNDDNFHTCDFIINVLGFGSTNFNCPSQVSVSLNGACERQLSATDILGVTFNPCDEDYIVEQLDEAGDWVPALVDASDVGNSFNARLTNFETGHSCETIVTVTGGEPNAITCPPGVIKFCNQPIDPAFTGTPVYSGCFDTLQLSYSDNLTFTQCPDSIAFQITRTWVSVSPNGSQDVCNQLITGKRFPLSMIQFPLDYDGIANPALVCEDSLTMAETAHPSITGWPLANGYVPTGSVHCKFAVSHVDQVTPICGDSYQIKRAWSVVNLCTAATRRDTQTILILDELPPNFEIPDSLYFSLSNGCIDSVFLPAANVLSECSAFGYSIQSDWGNFTTNGAWIHPDTLPGNYEIVYELTDACGNDSLQTMVLKITEETLVNCPLNDTVTCDYYFSVISPALQIGNYQALAPLGLPSFYENCSFEITETDTASVDDCGIGWLIRDIVAYNEVDTLNCQQNIIVQHLSNFEVEFPADTSICFSPAQVDLVDPLMSSINCEEVSVSFTDNIMPSGIQGCFTVNRNWVAINTCIYNGSSTGDDTEIGARTFKDNGDGYMAYTQVIHVNNNAPISFPNGCEIPDLYVGNDDCTADLLVPTPNVQGCGANPTLTVSGSLGTTLGAPVSILPGTYNVTYKATDECGKMQTCLTTFEVFDTVSPVAVCHSSLSIEIISPSGQVSIGVWDLNNGSHDNCDDNLTFSFAPNAIEEFLTFDCCQIGMNEVEIWVTDDEGDQSSCTTNLIIFQTISTCDCDPNIGGKILTETGLEVEDVDVNISAPVGFNETVKTDASGNYNSPVFIGSDYLVLPSKDNNALNGVTTFDLVIIRKHILGIDTLDSPYKMIAADVNHSGAVTTFDMVEIRKVILFINLEFPVGKSWRFVDASYVFPDPLNPFSAPFPEMILVEDVIADQLGIDFIGIKKGDVNNSASPAFGPQKVDKK